MATEPDELRSDLLLEVVELRDPPGVDELVQPGGDAGTDAAKLLDTTAADELRDGSGRLSNRLEARRYALAV